MIETAGETTRSRLPPPHDPVAASRDEEGTVSGDPRNTAAARGESGRRSRGERHIVDRGAVADAAHQLP